MSTDTSAPEGGAVREYRKKPVVVKAVQYTEGAAQHIIDERLDEFHGFAPQEVTSEEGVTYRTGRLRVQTLESDPNHPHIAEPGDWIIWGIKGEPYPCKPDIFEATYEVASPTKAEAVRERIDVPALNRVRRLLFAAGARSEDPDVLAPIQDALTILGPQTVPPEGGDAEALEVEPDEGEPPSNEDLARWLLLHTEGRRAYPPSHSWYEIAAARLRSQVESEPVASRELWNAVKVTALRELVRPLVDAYEDERAMPSPMGDALIRTARSALAHSGDPAEPPPGDDPSPTPEAP